MVWILTSLLILLAFMGVGGLVLRVLHRYSFSLIEDDHSPDAKLMWMVALLGALGMGIGGNLILLTGFLKLPSPLIAWGLTVLFAGYGIYFLYSKRQHFQIPFNKLSFKRPITYYYLCCFSACTLGFILLLWMTLNLEIDVDSVAYHLTVPRAYINERRVFSCVFEIHANINCLSEMSYLWAFILQPDSVITPKLMELARCLLAVFALYGVASYLYNRHVAITASTLLLLMEEFARYGVTTHIDAGQSLYVIVSVGLLCKWLENPQRKHYLYMGALICGFIVAVKQIGVLIMGCILFSFLVFYLKDQKQNRHQILSKKILFTIIATTSITILSFSLFLFKNLLFTGNPFFPFLTKLFPLTDEASLGYIHLLNYYPHKPLLEYIPPLVHLHTVISNVRITNVNGILFLSPLALLFFTYARKQLSNKNNQDQRLAVILVTLLVLPIFLLAPFWRFLIAAYPLTILVALGEFDLWLRPQKRHKVIYTVSIGLIFYFSHTHLNFCRYNQVGEKALATPPSQPILTRKQQGEVYKEYYPEKRITDYVNETLSPSDRLMAAIDIQTLPLLKIPFIANVPCISQEAVTTMEMHEMTAQQMEETFEQYGVTHYLSAEPLSDGEPLIFRIENLIPLKKWDHNDSKTVLYRFEVFDEELYQ